LPYRGFEINELINGGLLKTFDIFIHDNKMYKYGNDYLIGVIFPNKYLYQFGTKFGKICFKRI